MLDIDIFFSLFELPLLKLLHTFYPNQLSRKICVLCSRKWPKRIPDICWKTNVVILKNLSLFSKQAKHLEKKLINSSHNLPSWNIDTSTGRGLRGCRRIKQTKSRKYLNLASKSHFSSDQIQKWMFWFK